MASVARAILLRSQRIAYREHSMMSKAILVVIVLYKKHPLQSETISSLKRGVTHSPGLLDLLDIILWDNSPDAIDQRSLPIACEYVFAGNNAGTSGAYNH